MGFDQVYFQYYFPQNLQKVQVKSVTAAQLCKENPISVHHSNFDPNTFKEEAMISRE